MVDQEKQQTLIQKTFAAGCNMANETAEYLASLQIGQTILKQTDRLLWTVEKCAEWSIPSQQQNKHHTSNGTFSKENPLVRPLPWIFFLPMLLFLRCIRLVLNIIALLLGFETVKAVTMVRFIQIRRRRIRALKFLGLRRIRHRKAVKENNAKMTWKETFYNIMSRAMCFRVTNADLYEEITIKKNEEKPQNVNRTRQKSVTGQDLKRKYMEILKNNYCDWDDVEDDEELIERITQIAEDDFEEDTSVMPAEDSATEDDSLSDTEDDVGSAASSVASTTSPQHPPSPHKIQRLSSHSSLANEIIAEELEESDSTTVSANSDDESSQQFENNTTPEKVDNTEENKKKHNLEPIVTSDEYYSPMNSISASPEPVKQETKPSNINQKHEIENQLESEPIQMNDNQNKIESPTTNENEKFISEEKKLAEKKVKTNHEPITARETATLGGKTNSNSNSHAFSPRAKKHKHRRRFSNLLRRKRK